MPQNKDNNIQYHNIAVQHHVQYEEHEQHFKEGERFRVAGTMYFSTKFDFESDAIKFNNAQKEANNQIDTWATVKRDTRVGGPVCVEFEGMHGWKITEYVDQVPLKAMIIEGQKREAARIALESALAWQAKQEGLIPKHEPTALEQLSKEHKLDVGTKLIIHGVDYGTITDSFIDGQCILVKTDGAAELFSNIDFRNEYNKLQNPCYYRDGAILQPQAENPLRKSEVVDFILANHADIPLRGNSRDVGFEGSEMVNQIAKNEQFMKALGLKMADYMQHAGVTNISQTSNQSVINDLVEMIKCEMVDQGYYVIPKDRPTDQEYAYLQSLGYTEEAMKEKAEILSKWLQDKSLTKEERVAAQSIVEGKVLHVIKDIEADSMKRKLDLPLIDLYAKFPDDINSKHLTRFMMDNESKIQCTHINLAFGTVEHEVTIQLPEFDKDSHQQVGADNERIASTSTDMYVTFDVSEAYRKLGGFDCQEMKKELQQNQEGQDREEDITHNR